VEYVVPKSAMPTGTSRYATEDGYRNVFRQSLPEAQRKYFGRFGVTASQIKDRGMVDASECNYNYPTPTDMTDSWIEANGSAQHEGISDPSFQGGFAGKCGTGETWQFEQDEDQWECSGETLSWSGWNYWTPDISDHDNTGNLKVGVVIERDIFSGTSALDVGEGLPENSFLRSYHGANSEVATIERVRIRCESGEKSKDQISMSEGYNQWDVNTDRSGGEIENDVYVWDEISISGGGKYTCRFWLGVDYPGKSDFTWENNLGNPDKSESNAASKFSALAEDGDTGEDKIEVNRNDKIKATDIPDLVSNTAGNSPGS